VRRVNSYASPHPATRRIEKTLQSTDEFPPPRRLYKVKAQNKETGATMLKNKVAVIYGSSGAVGSAIAGAFAREGARVFLTGRNVSKVDTVAQGIMDAGGRAEAAQVDALDERAVDGHLQSVIDKAGRVDVSFNAVGIPNTMLQGVPLVDLDVDQFLLPIATYARSYFLTARLAARRMLANGSGVIMTITAVPSRVGIPLLGGFAPAQATVEALTGCVANAKPLAPRDVRAS
jgi:NAD(P)-dependent dehydrogenase (short-subunit alcohol dehydrogenase family)